jgi:hypothetical protein
VHAQALLEKEFQVVFHKFAGLVRKFAAVSSDLRVFASSNLESMSLLVDGLLAEFEEDPPTGEERRLRRQLQHVRSMMHTFQQAMQEFIGGTEAREPNPRNRGQVRV